MKKLKISREEVEAEAGKLNIKIDDIHLVINFFLLHVLHNTKFFTISLLIE